MGRYPLADFLGKAYAYQLYFNFKRKNSNKDDKPPVELLREDCPAINPNVLNLPPVLLETFLKDYEEPKYYLDEKKLEEEYVNMGLTTEHGYLLPYVLTIATHHRHTLPPNHQPPAPHSPEPIAAITDFKIHAIADDLKSTPGCG